MFLPLRISGFQVIQSRYALLIGTLNVCFTFRAACTCDYFLDWLLLTRERLTPSNRF